MSSAEHSSQEPVSCQNCACAQTAVIRTRTQWRRQRAVLVAALVVLAGMVTAGAVWRWGGVLGIRFEQGASFGPWSVAPDAPGTVAVTGPNAGVQIARRNLADWPASPAPGDRYTWYNPDGTLRLSTDSVGDLLAVTSTGNVGIGTTAPGGRIDVRDSGGRPLLSTVNDLSFLNAPTRSYLSGNAWYTPVDGWSRFDTASPVALIMTDGRAGKGDVNFLTAVAGANPITWSGKVTILNNGNVGIGTMAPLQPLTVAGNILSTGATGSYIGFGDGNGLHWDSSNGAFLSSTGHVNINIDSDNNNPGGNNFYIRANVNTATGGDTLFRVGEDGAVRIGEAGFGGSLRSYGATGTTIGFQPLNALTWDAGAGPYINSTADFRVNLDADNNGVNTEWFVVGKGVSTATGGTELFRVQANGRVGIATSAPDQTLSVNGNASKVGGGSWATFSDERLKDVAGAFDAGLAEITQLQPLRYRYRADNPLGIPDEGEHVGFSAQDVEKVIPAAVTANDQGYRMVENDPILWAMLNAIKELKAENEALKERLAKLEQSFPENH